MIVFRHPFVLLSVSLVTLWFSAWLGAARFMGLKSQVAELNEEFGVVRGATLTLLALIIGFTLSMALSRFEQRRNDEAQEANAIRTEYLRAALLPEEDTAKTRALLRSYLDQRILFYTADDRQLSQISLETASLQGGLWLVVQTSASAHPTAVTSLVVSGMNEVLNAQGLTQAAWRSQIPAAGWILMSMIAICGAVLVGVGAKDPKSGSRLLAIMPVIVSIAFFFIADIDSPREGLIRVAPANLLSLSESLHAQ